jgi:hydrophobic/amphiphilic exporter-1 (mainly G- bacteria), HAE1 family
VLILLLFLKSIRTTLIIGISIPVSIIATFVLMFLSNTTLNLISMGGLALGVGMMVDSSIVVIENIYRLKREGKSALEASLSGAKQVAGAVVASTLTTVVVFVPIIFTEGWAAELFKQMALTVTFALLASLVVSLTVIPMLSSKLLRGRDRNEEENIRNKTAFYSSKKEGEDLAQKGNVKNPRFLGIVFSAWDFLYAKIENFYVKALEKVMKRRILTVVAVFVIFVLSIGFVPLIGVEFLPTSDEGSFTVDIEYPNGTLLEKTDRLTLEIEKKVSLIPDVETVFVSVGGSDGAGFRGVRENTASITATLLPRNIRKSNTSQIVEDLRNELSGKFSGADIKINMADSIFGGGGGGPGGGSPVQIEISGYNLDRLISLSNQVEEMVKKTEGTRQVQNSISEAVPEVSVYVDRVKAQQYGIQGVMVASNLRTAIDGQVVTRYRVDGDEIDVKVQFPEAQRENFEQINSIKMTAPNGANVTLGEIAQIRQEVGPLSISRKNQSRYVTVTSEVYGRALGNVISDVRKQVESIELPDGYGIVFGGQNEEMMSAFKSLGLALILSILLIYMVMASQFESLTQPFHHHVHRSIGFFRSLHRIGFDGKEL